MRLSIKRLCISLIEYPLARLRHVASLILARHCEERSDEAIQTVAQAPGLLRFARNDELLPQRHQQDHDLAHGPESVIRRGRFKCLVTFKGTLLGTRVAWRFGRAGAQPCAAAARFRAASATDSGERTPSGWPSRNGVLRETQVSRKSLTKGANCRAQCAAGKSKGWDELSGGLPGKIRPPGRS
jgi:hypothetical protein